MGASLPARLWRYVGGSPLRTTRPIQLSTHASHGKSSQRFDQTSQTLQCPRMCIRSGALGDGYELNLVRRAKAVLHIVCCSPFSSS